MPAREMPVRAFCVKGKILSSYCNDENDDDDDDDDDNDEKSLECRELFFWSSIYYIIYRHSSYIRLALHASLETIRDIRSFAKFAPYIKYNKIYRLRYTRCDDDLLAYISRAAIHGTALGDQHIQSIGDTRLAITLHFNAARQSSERGRKLLQRANAHLRRWCSNSSLPRRQRQARGARRRTCSRIQLQEFSHRAERQQQKVADPYGRGFLSAVVVVVEHDLAQKMSDIICIIYANAFRDKDGCGIQIRNYIYPGALYSAYIYTSSSSSEADRLSSRSAGRWRTNSSVPPHQHSTTILYFDCDSKFCRVPSCVPGEGVDAAAAVEAPIYIYLYTPRSSHESHTTQQCVCYIQRRSSSSSGSVYACLHPIFPICRFYTECLGVCKHQPPPHALAPRHPSRPPTPFARGAAGQEDENSSARVSLLLLRTAAIRIEGINLVFSFFFCTYTRGPRRVCILRGLARAVSFYTYGGEGCDIVVYRLLLRQASAQTYMHVDFPDRSLITHTRTYGSMYGIRSIYEKMRVPRVSGQKKGEKKLEQLYASAIEPQLVLLLLYAQAAQRRRRHSIAFEKRNKSSWRISGRKDRALQVNDSLQFTARYDYPKSLGFRKLFSLARQSFRAYTSITLRGELPALKHATRINQQQQRQ
ncbi:unnamed protein product [Trichogramma brassicae]|uniref:Uncharacterized protein n=1 Tax=Trichogramma brassicae TaxID=86971 RepID=A0A6H5I1C6_9HYME|nr:unnamed protein product [Trichogramma brassicae]